MESNRLFEESTEILRSVGDTEYLSNVLIAHGKVLSVMGKLSLAHEKIGEGIQLANKDKNGWVLGLGYVNQGYVFGQEENYERAYELIQSGLSIYKEIKNLHGVAFALNALGPVLIQLERFEEGLEALKESLALSIQFHDRWGMGMAYGRLGMLSLQKRELSNARSLLQKSLAMFNELGMRWDVAWALMQLGKVAMASEEWLEAEQLLKHSIKLSLASQALPQVIETVVELVVCFAHQGKVSEALELILPAMDHPAITGSAKHRAQELKTAIEQQVDISNPTSETLETVLARFVV